MYLSTVDKRVKRIANNFLRIGTIKLSNSNKYQLKIDEYVKETERRNKNLWGSCEMNVGRATRRL